MGLFILLGGLITLLVFDFFAGLTSPSDISEITEEVISGEGLDKIVIIPIHGPIGLADEVGNSASKVTNEHIVQAMLLKAQSDDLVKAVVLDIDSPGGSVVASRKIYEALLAFPKPVVAAYTGNVAASGALYLSMGADKIVAYPETITGSVGVIAEFLDVSELLKTYGVRFTTIKTGQFKDIGSPTRQMTDAEQAMLQDLYRESYEKFIQVISDARHLPIDQVRQLADGRIWSGTTAKSLGMVDELGDLPVAEDVAKNLAGLTEVQIVGYSVDSPFGSLLSLLQSRADPLHQLAGLFIKQQTTSSWHLAYRLN
ncbi:MAG: signal peptide peptidase SppA [Patescibacteria group bacterium]